LQAGVEQVHLVSTEVGRLRSRVCSIFASDDYCSAVCESAHFQVQNSARIGCPQLDFSDRRQRDHAGASVIKAFVPMWSIQRWYFCCVGKKT